VNSITHSDGSGSPFLAFDLTRNQDGTLREVTEVDAGVSSATSYGYDLLRRPTAEQRTGANPYSLAWAFNPETGDRTTETRDGILTTFSFDASRRPTVAASPTGTQSFTWNDNNALAGRTFGPNSITYDYNPESNLLKIVAGPNAAEYMSDGLNRRVFAELSSGGTPPEQSQSLYFRNSALQRVRTVSGTTTITNNTIGPDGAVYVASGSEQHGLQNQWGTYQAGTDENGNVLPRRLRLDIYRNPVSPLFAVPVVGAQIAATFKQGDDDRQESSDGSAGRLASIDHFTAQNLASIPSSRSVYFRFFGGDPFAGVSLAVPVGPPGAFVRDVAQTTDPSDRIGIGADPADDLSVERFLSFVVPPAIQIGSTLFTGAPIPTVPLNSSTIAISTEGPRGDFVTIEGDIQ